MSHAQRRQSPAERLKHSLEPLLGPGAILDSAEEMAPYLADQRGRYNDARAAFVVRPSTSEQVAGCVGLASEFGVAIVPQGGNTGLVGGSIPGATGEEILLSLSRLNRIRALDALNDTITVEAGCILKDIQEAAAEADRLFPLSLGAEGSCQIGGNISTNAGGVHVIRYGSMRELVLGLEVVLPDGRIWDGLRALRKDNTGYDLKQLFIGAEGTLGIITAAVLKLFPRPRQRVVAFAAVRDPQSALDLLALVRADCGEAVSAVEFLPRIGMDMCLRHVPGTVDPLAEPHDWYLLIELQAATLAGGLREGLESALAAAYEQGLVPDATIAESEAQAESFWRLREAVVEAQKQEGGSIKHDVAVPVSAVPAFLERAGTKVREMVPGIRPVPFGHLGDGNIHFNLSQPEDAEREAFLARWDEVNAAVHAIVRELGGSISAEHGLGRLRKAENMASKPAVEIELMRRLKHLLDPQGLMNPGKVID